VPIPDFDAEPARLIDPVVRTIVGGRYDRVSANTAPVFLRRSRAIAFLRGAAPMLGCLRPILGLKERDA